MTEALGEGTRRASGLDASSASKRIEDDWNGKLRAALGQRLKTDVGARKWDIPGPSKPDGAWTFQRDGQPKLALFSGKMGTRQIDQAINTAGEYQRNIAQVEAVEEAFGVTYPERGNEFHRSRTESHLSSQGGTHPPLGEPITEEPPFRRHGPASYRTARERRRPRRRPEASPIRAPRGVGVG